jgi:hypothetical protein
LEKSVKNAFGWIGQELVIWHLLAIENSHVWFQKIWKQLMSVAHGNN